jgi:competence protein ComGC
VSFKFRGVDKHIVFLFVLFVCISFLFVSILLVLFVCFFVKNKKKICYVVD